MNFEDLRNPHSDLIKAAFERSCPVCKAARGEECLAMHGGPLTSICGHYAHRIRADGIKYTMKDEGMKG